MKAEQKNYCMECLEEITELDCCWNICNSCRNSVTGI